MLKALDNPLRIRIIELLVNSTPVAFTSILAHLEEQSGQSINRGTLAYHLDLLVESNMVTRELERGNERTYSRYDVTSEALELLRGLNLIIES